MEKNDSKITAQVQMLGDFRLTIGDVTISSKSQQAKKPWNILEYLIYYNDRDVTSEELVSIVWPEERDVNAANALKTLIFRTRKLLSPFKISALQLISQTRGSYCWNPEIRLNIDAYEFQRLYDESQRPDISEDQKLGLLMDAISLYKGDFLSKTAWEPWVIPVNRQYHDLYIQAVLQAIDLLMPQEAWDQIAEICQHAVTVEAYNEEFHYYLIYALYNGGYQNMALEKYRLMVDSFYTEFAITPSTRMTDLYKMIQNRERGVNTDLTLIQSSMQEEGKIIGAYPCEFTVFRDIYQLERRSIARTGDSIFLCLLTLSTEDGDLPRSSILNRAMDHLQNAVASSLRHGDVYTRYSVSQYMILLPSASYENGEMVMQRIVRNYKKAYLRKELVVNFALQAIPPIED